MKRIGVCAAAAVLAAAMAHGQAERGDWPEWRRDLSRTASRAVDVPIDPNDLNWVVEIEGGSYSGGITLGTGNTLFVKGSGVPPTGGTIIHCLDRTDGSVIWKSDRFFSAAGDYGGVSVGTDKVFVCIYHFAGSPHTKTVALDINTGALIWENTESKRPGTTPALGTVNNSLGHRNLYITDRGSATLPKQLIAIDSETGVTQWTADLFGSVGEPIIGQVGPLWVDPADGKQCLALFGTRGAAQKSGAVFKDNGDGTYTMLWQGGPSSFNWVGNGVLSPDGSRIYVSTFWDAGANTIWAIDPYDGHVIWTRRDLNSFPPPALEPDGSALYAAGSNIPGGGGAVAKYREDANGCGELVWKVTGLGPEIVAMTVIDGYIYAAANGTANPADGKVYVIRDHGSWGELVRTSNESLHRDYAPGGAQTVVVDPDGYGYAAENTAIHSGGPANRRVYSFKPVPLPAPALPRITSIARGSIDLAWEPAVPPFYRVWRADDVGGPFAALSGLLTEEAYSDPAPPADRGFYKVELIRELPTVDVAFWDFESGEQGWTHGGGVDDWERGTPVDHTGVGKAPDGALSGDYAWATKVAGDYSPNATGEPAWLRSPDFTLSEGRVGSVEFGMWVNTEPNIDILDVKVYRASDNALIADLLTGYSAEFEGIECWPKFRYELAGLGGVPVYLRFEFLADDSVEGPGVYVDDVVISEGAVFVPGPGHDGLVAFDPDGSVRWVYAAPGTESWSYRGSYALSPDESTLYALHSGGLLAGGVWAINTADGSVKWHLNSADPLVAGSPDAPGGYAGDFRSTPVVGADGTLYCVDINGTVCAIQDHGNSGSIVWAVHQPGGQATWNYAEGAIGPDGEVMFVSNGGGANVFLFQSAGTGSSADGVWPRHQRDAGNKGYATTGGQATSGYLSASIPGGLWCAPALSKNGHWILPSNDASAQLKALDANLTVVWERAMGDWADGGAAIAPDGTIYAGDNAGNVYSLTESETGGVWSAAENWSVNLGAPVNSRLNIGPDGTIYAVAGSTVVHALNPADGSTKWSTPVGGGDSWQMTTALSADGSVVFFRTKGGEGLLYAIDAADGTVLWTRFVGSGWDGLHPVIGSDGTIYQGATNIGAPIIP